MRLVRNIEGLPFSNIEVEAKRVISIDQYYELLSLLNSQYPSEKLNYVMQLDGNKRRVGSRIEVKNKLYVKKDESLSYDRDDLKVINGFIITVADEIQMSGIKFNPRMTRKIKRTNFFTKHFTISVSRVDQQNRIRYELEIEMNSTQDRKINITFEEFNKRRMYKTHYYNDGKVKVKGRKINIPLLYEYTKVLSDLITPNRPHDIKAANLTHTVMKNYCVTPKADGKRVRILVNPEFTAFGADERNVKSDYVALFDAEEVDGKYYIFDILFYNTPVTDLNLAERTKLIKDLDSKGVLPGLVKEHYDSHNFFDAINKALDVPLPIDGLIFTPKYEGYNSTNVFKWKPIDKLTIDLRVKSDRLYVSSYGKDVKVDEEYDHSSNMLIRDGDIVEFLFTTPLSPYRNRTLDGTKDKPNSIVVYNSLKSIVRDPITTEDIKGNTLKLMRKYHNREKKKLYMMLFNNGIETIVDVGSGRGGDMLAWKKYGFDVISYEPNEEHYDELLQRGKSLQVDFEHHNEDFRSFNSSYPNSCLTLFNSITFFTNEEIVERSRELDEILIIGFNYNKCGDINDPNIEVRKEGNQVYIRLEASTVSGQYENIMDFDSLISDLEQTMFLAKDYYLDGEKNLPDLHYHFSSSYRVLYFRKKVEINIDGLLALDERKYFTTIRGIDLYRVGTVTYNSFKHSTLYHSKNYRESSLEKRLEFPDPNINVIVLDSCAKVDSVTYAIPHSDICVIVLQVGDNYEAIELDCGNERKKLLMTFLIENGL